MPVVRADALDFLQLLGRRSANPFKDLAEAAAAQLSARVVQLTPGVERTAHLHPLTAEVFHVVQGQGQLWLDGQREPLGPGDTALVPAGTPHATLPDPGGPMLLVCFFPHPDLAANLVELDLRPD